MDKTSAQWINCLIYLQTIFFLDLYSKSSLRDTLDLNDRSVPRCHGLQTRTRRHWLWEKINVHLIHSRKILHIRQVYIVFDDLLKRRSSQFKNFFEVLENGSLLLFITVSELMGRRSWVAGHGGVTNSCSFDLAGCSLSCAENKSRYFDCWA